MPSDNENSKELFLALRAHIKREEHSKCVEVCDRILTAIPGDIDALRVKVSSLLSLDNIEDALSVCRNVEALSFEWAYCLYRLNKLEEALKICSKISEPKPEHVVNLEAQAYYRLQKYDLAVDRYMSITSGESPADLETDLLSNVYASFTSAGRGSEALAAFPVDEDVVGDSFELMFNNVCALISSGQIADAAAALEQNEVLCREVLSREGLSEHEIQKELTNIQLQKSFVGILSNRSSDDARQAAVNECLAILRSTGTSTSGAAGSSSSSTSTSTSGAVGKEGKAEKKLQKVKKNHELQAVAANNLAVLRGDKDLPDSLRRLRTTITAESEEKLSLNQLMEIRYNRCILLLHMRKVDESVRVLDELDEIYGASTIQSIVLRASIAAMAGNFEKSDEILLSHKKRLESVGTDASVINKLSIVYVQTLITRKRYADALACLGDIRALTYTPAGVSATLYLKALQQQAACVDSAVSPQSILDKVASEYLVQVATALDECSDDEYSAANGTQTLFYIAQLLELRQCHKASAGVLQVLLRCGGDDMQASERLAVTAHLVAALSHHSPEEAERYASVLPQVETGSFDAAELENADIPRLLKMKATGAQASEAVQGDARLLAAEARRKKHNLARRAARKSAYLLKLEAEGKYDPARPVKPDAERWISLKQRAHNKRGRKNYGKFVGGQGSGDGAQKDMLKLDAMARSLTDKPVNSGTVMSSSNTGGNKKKKSNKKKK